MGTMANSEDPDKMPQKGGIGGISSGSALTA